MPVNPNSPHNPSTAPPILKREIEEAQANTKSNMAAARYLGVPYIRYKKYAELYGLFEGHLNKDGHGIDKGFSKRPNSIPLREILAGKHPTYSVAKLKNRLVARKKLTEVCNLCGFHERRVTDNKMPLILSFKDNNRQNYAMENMELLCYNCMFLTTGAPTVAYRQSIKKALTGKYTFPTPDQTVADAHDPEDKDNPMDATMVDLRERDQWLAELEEESTD